METLWIDGVLTAQSAIHCGSTTDKTGNLQLMNKRKRVLENGKKDRLPLIPANSIRGILRRYIIGDLFDQVGYQVQTPKIHYIKSGGALENGGKDGGTLNLELKRLFRGKLSPLALVGAAFGNQTITGKLVVSDGLLVCRELNYCLPIKSNSSFHDFIEWVSFTRHADRELSEVVESNMRKGAKGTMEAEPTIQMKVDVECLIAGSQFYHQFCLKDTTSLEKSCFARMIELWRERPFVGGKSASGFGVISASYPALKWNSKEYLDYLTEHKTEICETLSHFDKP
jgi:hypothetical protein